MTKEGVVVWIVTPKLYIEYRHPILINVTLFGNKVFEDVIRLGILRWDHLRFKVDHNAKWTNYPCKRQQRRGHRYRKSPYVTWKQRLETFLQPKEFQEPPEAKERQGKILPWNRPKEHDPAAPELWTCGLHSCERINFCCLKSSSV